MPWIIFALIINFLLLFFNLIIFQDVGYGNLKEDVISSSDDKKLIDQLTVERDKLQQDVERLRNHLIQVEESYTQEFLLIEEREKQLQQQLNRVERELQEANEQLKLYKSDVIQEQIKSLKTQRDIALTENSQLDDKLQQAKASINNLQLVIEQIQKGFVLSFYYHFNQLN